MMEFHVSRKARDKYDFDQSLFSLTGNVIFANFHAARQFVQRINDKQDLVNFPEKAVQAGQINALGLIDEIFHYLFHLYLKENKSGLISDLYEHLEICIGKSDMEKAIASFADMFPPVSVYQNQTTLQAYLADTSEDTPNTHLVLEEMLMLWLTNVNPATSPYMALFDDSELAKTTLYPKIMLEFHDFFKQQPFFGPENLDIISMLRKPAIEVPHSLSGQLEYIRQKWGRLLGSYLYKLLGSLDLIKEEQRLIFAGPGPTVVPDMISAFGALEAERFSQDSDWMPNVVMIAKNSYVWLNQLAKLYNRPVSRLDQIPDEALDDLARWGFTGLWLIGLWERSESSKRIKQMCGNPDAVASAYSLSRYEIASDLGGERAFQDLRERAARRGIRLASDMVPNHMGIDSNWVYDHPDWFVSLNYSPFPSYSFTGVDLSLNPHISINLEDHYYDRTDAAVVFKRYDHGTGQDKYIYHGNDGTSMPWNDTAQLNYLLPEVREAVIQTILSVARKFPIIRFDAAMTLTKKHYQRLWFPQPGTGGDIPSRADHSLTKEAFNQAMPEEFWREVVDRVAAEVPDTLLLAEAFWLMEGYFVRTLGMHRVYNSAFMNMLRNEENDEYHQLIKNTLTFDPQILKRYVNFMNNPDERTAVEQFGKGDKYFGICTLMATLPGLPMFGHGQVEGYAEKYGMEYYRAYWDEYPDQYLIERHERDIFPILHHRYLFADVKNFLLYDFYTKGGQVDENVYAYSNGTQDKRALVVYHNKFGQTSGWIKASTAFTTKSADVSHLVQNQIYDGLNLSGDHNTFAIFRDYASNLEYIRSSQEIRDRGMYFELDAYKYHVFMDFREVYDDHTHKYARLNSYLTGRGVPSIEEALHELTLSPVLIPIRELVNADRLSSLSQAAITNKKEVLDKQLIDMTMDVYARMIDAVAAQLHKSYDRQAILDETKASLVRILSLGDYNKLYGVPASLKFPKVLAYINKNLASDPELLYILVIWTFMRCLGGISTNDKSVELSRSLIDEWGLTKIIENVLQELDLDRYASYRAGMVIKFLTAKQNWYAEADKSALLSLFQSWLADDQVRTYLEINRHNDILWFNKEAFDFFLWWMMVAALISSGSKPTNTSSKHLEEMLACYEIITELQKAEGKSGFKIAKLLEALS